MSFLLLFSFTDKYIVKLYSLQFFNFPKFNSMELENFLGEISRQVDDCVGGVSSIIAQSISDKSWVTRGRHNLYPRNRE